jgi:hypothetical protein
VVCPIKTPKTKALQERQRANAEPAGDPALVAGLLDALRSPDPATRREAARLMEISSLGALNAADQWRVNHR